MEGFGKVVLILESCSFCQVFDVVLLFLRLNLLRRGFLVVEDSIFFCC